MLLSRSLAHSISLYLPASLSPGVLIIQTQSPRPALNRQEPPRDRARRVLRPTRARRRPHSPAGPLPAARLPPRRIPLRPRRSSHAGADPEPAPVVSTCICTRDAVMQPRDDHPGERGPSKRAMPNMGKRAMLRVPCCAIFEYKDEASRLSHRSFLHSQPVTLSSDQIHSLYQHSRSQKPPPTPSTLKPS